MDRLPDVPILKIADYLSLKDQIHCREFGRRWSQLSPVGRPELEVAKLPFRHIRNRQQFIDASEVELALTLLLPKWTGSIRSINLCRCHLNSDVLQLISSNCPAIHSLAVDINSFWQYGVDWEKVHTIDMTRYCFHCAV